MERILQQFLFLKMNKRKLGITGLEIAPFVFGGNVFGWTVNEEKAFKLLDQFFENGFNMIDTANSYPNWVPGNKGGESETIIGKWLKRSGHRKDVIIATKVGAEMSPGKKGLSKKHILEEVEASLKRLQTDYIDLYQSHYDFPQTPFEETLSAFDKLIKEGKVRFTGASNITAERLQEAIRISKAKKLYQYKTLQPRYNLYEREFENAYAEVVKENQLGVITYSSLASGFLSGKYRSEKDFSKSDRGKGMKRYVNKKGLDILNALEIISAKYQCSFATIALAWILKNPLVTAPIASATNETQLSELMKSANIKLNQEDINLLNAAGK